MMNEEREYQALLVDTSIFDANGLRLERGLLRSLSQFKRAPIKYLLPDVIRDEVKNHLEEKVKDSKTKLEKALNNAGTHLTLGSGRLAELKEELIEGRVAEAIAEERLQSFVDLTGALVLEAGGYVSVSEVLQSYFSGAPPFDEHGNRKNEFPDAIALMAVESWAREKDAFVLAVSADNDWSRYCESSERINIESDFSKALDYLNRDNAPHALVAQLEDALRDRRVSAIEEEVRSYISNYCEELIPDQDADSTLFWEPEGVQVWMEDFYFVGDTIRVVEKEESKVVLEVFVAITVSAVGDFKLSHRDPVDKDYIVIDRPSVQVKEEFSTPLLITLSGNLDGPIGELDLTEVEVVEPIGSIDFGYLEPFHEEYE